MTQNASNDTAQNPESTQFGERAVTPDEKTGLVRDVFDSVADQYDIMNDLMSGGVHRLWKNHLIKKIRPTAGLSYLDVAGGTGDIAFRIREEVGADAQITLCDLNWDMLRVGRDRSIDRGFLTPKSGSFNWITGNAESLPVPDESIDVYTIAFGLRNVTRIDDALKEAFRVLKPGGRFYCLEFSHVKNPLISKLYDGFSFGVIPHIGQAIANDRDSYQYLVESIRKFPKQRVLQHRLSQAGFSNTSYENLTFGVAAIHYGIKT